MQGKEHIKIYPYIKRASDLVIGLAGTVLLSPIFLVTAICIKIDSPGKVFFLQERLGKNGRVFKIIKFRSMCENAEHMGSGVYSEKGDMRVTKVGRFIRATSIDELPQLVNLIRGDMSLIGPRPPLTYHPWPVEKYTKEQFHMFDVRPGITGWAQIHSRVSSKGQKNFFYSQRSCLNVGFCCFYSYFRHKTTFFNDFSVVSCEAFVPERW